VIDGPSHEDPAEVERLDLPETDEAAQKTAVWGQLREIMPTT
jgi:hypothetical protein